MDINELISKFINDEKFREEIVALGKRDGTKAVIKKYNIPYSEEELFEIIKAKTEQSNCDGSVSKEITNSFLTLGVLCIVHAIAG